MPDLIFVIDTNKEQLAIKEAERLNIPVVAILDTNCDPDGILYPIPGNDDAAAPSPLLRPRRPRRHRRHLAQPGRGRVDFGAQEEPPPKSCRRSRRAPASRRTRTSPRPDGVGLGEDPPADTFELLSRAARRAGRSRQAAGRRPAARQEAQRCRLLPLLAARGDDAGGRDQGRRRPEARRPHPARRLGQARIAGARHALAPA